jgi:hypothetical protein
MVGQTVGQNGRSNGQTKRSVKSVGRSKASDRS